jgi:hypothetical protein
VTIAVSAVSEPVYEVTITMTSSEWTKVMINFNVIDSRGGDGSLYAFLNKIQTAIATPKAKR